jgi:magnesium transporter
MEPMTSEHGVRTRMWRNGTVEADDFPFEQISDYLEQPDCLVWADICAPDQRRLNALADELSLDPHAVEDAVERHERPKASRYATHMFLSAYDIRFDRESGELTTSQVAAFVLRNAVVTVRQSEDVDMDQVVAAWDANGDLIKFGSKALVHGLLDVLVDGQTAALEELDDEIDKIEDILFEETRSTVREVQIRSYALRRSLVTARRAVLPMREVVSSVMRHADDVHPELEPYYDDLYDHVIRATEWTESLRDLISSIFETNLSLADSRLNTVMKKLTAWAAIIAVPTAVTGFYGQNVPYPGFGAHWGFWVSTVVMLVCAAGLYVIFRRKDWI